MKKIVVIGAGGFAREVLWILNKINRKHAEWEVLGYIDEDESKHYSVINGLSVLGDFEWFDKFAKDNLYAVCAIGDPRTRRNLIHKAMQKGVNFYPIVDPEASFSSDNVNIGKGSVIASGVIMTDNINIGEHSIVNLNCTIGHDASIGDFSTINPLVAISGSVTIKSGVVVGAGTIIVPGIHIEDNSFVCAGSVVTKNVESGLTVGGMPARMIKSASNSKIT